MPQIAGGFKKHGVLTDVHRKIADPLQRADNEDQMQVILAAAARLLDAGAKCGSGLLIHPVQSLVPAVQRGTQRRITLAAGGDGIPEQMIRQGI